MRAVPESLDPAVVAAIDARLDGVESDHGVRIAWAIESGSRAWGFPSPDSDYDCRFLYVRPLDDYLTPWPERDVVETPLDAVLDVNGWDLVKAVDLLVRSNATVLEWLTSPIVYRGDRVFRDAVLEAAPGLVDHAGIGRHYTHLAQTQWVRHGGAVAQMPLKRLLYALRPAVAVDWMLARGPGELPPMDLPTLLEGVDLPHGILDEVEALLVAKARTRELGSGPVPGVVRDYVERQVSRGLEAYEHVAGDDLEARRARGADLFRTLVRGQAGSLAGSDGVPVPGRGR